MQIFAGAHFLVEKNQNVYVAKIHSLCVVRATSTVHHVRFIVYKLVCVALGWEV